MKSFDIENYDANIQLNNITAKDKAIGVIKQFEHEDDGSISGLYLHGNTGSGKTLLACLILNEIIFRFQMPVQFVKITRGFFNRIKASYNVESSTYGSGDDIFKKFAETEALVIDDFGVQSDSEWEQRTLYDLIDARYEHEKTTIITSNIPPFEIQSVFKNRTYSRLKEMTVFQELISPDYRDRFQD